ncbi:MAG: hypothetical protein ACOC46_04005, partial [Pirellulales bacterium]
AQRRFAQMLDRWVAENRPGQWQRLLDAVRQGTCTQQEAAERLVRLIAGPQPPHPEQRRSDQKRG